LTLLPRRLHLTLLSRLRLRLNAPLLGRFDLSLFRRLRLNALFPRWRLHLTLLLSWRRLNAALLARRRLHLTLLAGRRSLRPLLRWLLLLRLGWTTTWRRLFVFVLILLGLRRGLRHDDSCIEWRGVD
jgi:hypothetical protein